MSAVEVEPQCGYGSPYLGPCQCGDAANHEPGGMFYREGRTPDWPAERVSPTEQLGEILAIMQRDEEVKR